MSVCTHGEIALCGPCIRCGAPVCCEWCCQLDERDRKIATLQAKVTELTDNLDRQLAQAMAIVREREARIALLEKVAEAAYEFRRSPLSQDLLRELDKRFSAAGYGSDAD